MSDKKISPDVDPGDVAHARALINATPDVAAQRVATWVSSLRAQLRAKEENTSDKQESIGERIARDIIYKFRDANPRRNGIDGDTETFFRIASATIDEAVGEASEPATADDEARARTLAEQISYGAIGPTTKAYTLALLDYAAAVRRETEQSMARYARRMCDEHEFVQPDHGEPLSAAGWKVIVDTLAMMAATTQEQVRETADHYHDHYGRALVLTAKRVRRETEHLVLRRAQLERARDDGGRGDEELSR